jgi:hypothetical protein
MIGCLKYFNHSAYLIQKNKKLRTLLKTYSSLTKKTKRYSKNLNSKYSNLLKTMEEKTKVECTKVAEEPGEEEVKTEKTGESEKKGEGEVKENEDDVNPYFIKAGSPEGIDYDKLIKKFGCSKISPELLER